jgi:hypothetical protein
MASATPDNWLIGGGCGVGYEGQFLWQVRYVIKRYGPKPKNGALSFSNLELKPKFAYVVGCSCRGRHKIKPPEWM